MAKKQKYLDYLKSLTKQGIKIFNIRGQKFTEDASFDVATVLNILKQNPRIVEIYIVPLLEDLMRQYNQDIVKISKTIYSDIPQMLEDQNMRRFTYF